MTREMELVDGLFREDVDYRDEGCDLSPSCLNCPLPRCRYDEPGGSRQLAKGPRDREVVRRRREEGASIAELARSFGLSKRTVHRIVRKDR